MNNNRLGKGLASLIGIDLDMNKNNPKNKDNLVTNIAIDKIIPWSEQPRKFFSQIKLQELADSIKEKGLLQPIIVRNVGDGKFLIVAGERRWKACKIAEFAEISCIVKNLSDREAAEYALIENVQRANLSPLEEAEAYRNLMKDFGYTQEEIAKSLGKSRSHIANMLRLLTLPENVKHFLHEGMITVGHAKTLLKSFDPGELAEQVVKDNLNVRQLDELVRVNNIISGKGNSYYKKYNPEYKDKETLELEASVSEQIGMRVTIDTIENNSGKVTIYYHGLQNLDTLLRLLSRSPMSVF